VYWVEITVPRLYAFVHETSAEFNPGVATTLVGEPGVPVVFAKR
jgi:hypothetical protein